MKILVIIGSTRQGRLGDKIGQWVLDQVKDLGKADFELVDLRDYPLPFFDEPISPSMIQTPYTHPVVKKWTAKVAEADGYIMVTPEYNHGYSAVLKNALDYVYKQWNNKTVGFVGYGSVGGARAVEQLRQVAAELQMVSVRNTVVISKHWEKIDEEGHFQGEEYRESLKHLVDQLLWWTQAFKKARKE